jgi:hypothetical protein
MGAGIEFIYLTPMASEARRFTGTLSEYEDSANLWFTKPTAILLSQGDFDAAQTALLERLMVQEPHFQ